MSCELPLSQHFPTSQEPGRMVCTRFLGGVRSLPECKAPYFLENVHQLYLRSCVDPVKTGEMGVQCRRYLPLFLRLPRVLSLMLPDLQLQPRKSLKGFVIFGRYVCNPQEEQELWTETL